MRRHKAFDTYAAYTPHLPPRLPTYFRGSALPMRAASIERDRASPAWDTPSRFGAAVRRIYYIAILAFSRKSARTMSVLLSLTAAGAGYVSAFALYDARAGISPLSPSHYYFAGPDFIAIICAAFYRYDVLLLGAMRSVYFILRLESSARFTLSCTAHFSRTPCALMTRRFGEHGLRALNIEIYTLYDGFLHHKENFCDITERACARIPMSD